jgi:hypothetical protein
MPDRAQGALAAERDELLTTVVAATHDRTPDRVRPDP